MGTEVNSATTANVSPSGVPTATSAWIATEGAAIHPLAATVITALSPS
jgi:hypothetical protein